jgi:hypothetical protein
MINSFQNYNINSQNRNIPNIPKAKQRVQTPLSHVSNNALVNCIQDSSQAKQNQRAQTALRYVTNISNIPTVQITPFIIKKKLNIFPSNLFL